MNEGGMTDWLGLALDAILIVVVGFGTAQVVRLIRQLSDLRASRAEMERFVRDFNTAVLRAEAGIKSLRAAARDSGDDLEKLVEKGILVRDELNFIVESADGVAERLSQAASQVLQTDRSPRAPDARAEGRSAAPAPQATNAGTGPGAGPHDGPSVSKAERELMQALQKLK